LFDFVTRAPRYWEAVVMDYAMPGEVLRRLAKSGARVD